MGLNNCWAWHQLLTSIHTTIARHLHSNKKKSYRCSTKMSLLDLSVILKDMLAKSTTGISKYIQYSPLMLTYEELLGLTGAGGSYPVEICEFNWQEKELSANK